MLQELKNDLAHYANPEKAAFFPRIFKTDKGEDNESDAFLGITVPNCRFVAKKYHQLARVDLLELLKSGWHEERLVALLIFGFQFGKADKNDRRELYKTYLNHTQYINNWELVDLSCRDIVGRYIYEHPEAQNDFNRLITSSFLWDRRIAIVSTFYFLMRGDPAPTLYVAEKLLPDTHDPIRKASGWMLRELGKRVDETILVDFLIDHYDKLPRTTLRYAIERFSPEVRKKYLAGNFS
jgi:3-methyladenine DNA glycosylase AlkD